MGAARPGPGPGPGPWPHDGGAELPRGCGAAGAAALAVRLVPAWRGADAGAVRGEAVAGGLTNRLLRLSAGAGCPDLLLRLYEGDTDAFVDRELEAAVLAQARAAGLGAPILASFANGRFELFLSAARTAACEDMSRPPLLPGVPRLMRRVHEHVRPEGCREPQQFARLRRWLRECVELAEAAGGGNGAGEGGHDFGAWQAEVDWLEALCAREGSPVVFCHNDVHALNVMVGVEEEGVEEEGTRVQLIDFEYGSYGHRGFDVGNHFNEYCGFECREELYPSEELRRSFCACYLGADAPAEDVERLLREAEVFSLASHLFWGLWGLLQSLLRRPPAAAATDFDYAAYARHRWAWFLRRKPAVLARRAAAPPAGAPA